MFTQNDSRTVAVNLSYILLVNFRAYFGNLNFFGGPSIVNAATSNRLKQIEAENEDAMFVFLSDVWLDQVKVRVMGQGHRNKKGGEI